MSELTSQPGPTNASSAIEAYYERLHSQCGVILAASMEGTNEAKIARSHQFVQEIELWLYALHPRREGALLKVAAYEYQFALLALAQGHYRHAFKGLRLVLELTLQSAKLSTNEIELREWLQNKKDTRWAALVDRENGVPIPGLCLCSILGWLGREARSEPDTR